MDDLMQMAQEAHRKLVTEDYPGHTGQLDPWTMRLLERFAQLVAKKAVEAERKACAAVCYRMAALIGDPIDQQRLLDCGSQISARR